MQKLISALTGPLTSSPYLNPPPLKASTSHFEAQRFRERNLKHLGLVARWMLATTSVNNPGSRSASNLSPAKGQQIAACTRDLSMGTRRTKRSSVKETRRCSREPGLIWKVFDSMLRRTYANKSISHILIGQAASKSEY